jgi:catechol 2,3-dioxygenase-like lactoylglutathione lyase family enzyme
MVQSSKPRVVSVNHVALEVGDIDEALKFYGRLFEFELRGKSDTMAFIDLGDQFIALQKGRAQPADDGRHFGLVVDDKDAARAALRAAGITPLDGPFLDFRDPWGNRIEIVGYDNIQFTKAPNVLRGMGLMYLTKNEKALTEIAKKGMAPGQASAAKIESISAVTLATHNMARAAAFYRMLGFEISHGGDDAVFTTFRAGTGFVNLVAQPAEQKWSWWGRVIFYHSDVDSLYQSVITAGYRPDTPPRDAEWGERFFHLTDPDGHELSFAWPLRQ